VSNPLASVRVQTRELEKAFTDIERSTRRATMWAVREAGRKTKQEAKRGAPVLTAAGDARGISRKQHAATARGDRTNAPVRGLLRASIGSSKRLREHGPDGFSVRVAPRGDRVHLYSGQAEARHGFMRKAYQSVAPQMHEIATRAYTRAMRKG